MAVRPLWFVTLPIVTLFLLYNFFAAPSTLRESASLYIGELNETHKHHISQRGLASSAADDLPVESRTQAERKPYPEKPEAVTTENGQSDSSFESAQDNLDLPSATSPLVNYPGGCTHWEYPTSKPFWSVILTARNDNYGGAFLHRYVITSCLLP